MEVSEQFHDRIYLSREREALCGLESKITAMNLMLFLGYTVDFLLLILKANLGKSCEVMAPEMATC